MRPLLKSTRSRCRVAAACLLGAGLAASTAWATPRSQIPSEVVFRFEVGHRYFDGVELTTVLLDSPRLTLATDTLGAWIRASEPEAAAGLTLRHRTIAGLTLSLSVLPHADDVASEEYWQAYVAGVQTQLGTTATAGDLADSADSRNVLRVLGGRTREALFTIAVSAPRAEYHIHASKAGTNVVFVLRGPATAVAEARDDFRFFLSRLERVTKP